jgi:hypothetical protein
MKKFKINSAKKRKDFKEAKRIEDLYLKYLKNRIGE